MDYYSNIPEGICDVCGNVSNVFLRTFIRLPGAVIDRLSGGTCQTCQGCSDSGKCHDYVNKLENTKYAEETEYKTLTDELEELAIRKEGNTNAEDIKKRINRAEEITDRLRELDKNNEARLQLARRFQEFILHEEANFIREHGFGVKNEKCQICGRGDSYLCIVEDHYGGLVEVLYESSGWFCKDCIILGLEQRYMLKATLDRVLGKEPRYVYERRAELMEKARLSYKGKPLVTVINCNEEGSSDVTCDKTCIKDCKCGDN